MLFPRSMTVVVNYGLGVSQRFDSILDGSFSMDYDPSLNEHEANTQAEPNYDQLFCQGIGIDIQTDTPILNQIEIDGKRKTRHLPVNYSPCLITKSGTCQSYHFIKVVEFSTFDTFYYELRGDTWCPYQGGPFCLTTEQTSTMKYSCHFLMHYICTSMV